ncbi:phytanoyl-CoA dioxygenase family protein [Micromonospora sp. NPDC049645]|uniref:phytanoyl-CoA dioxygenase family protein n=1 Tax=Micromonospora sp. NPDC049645 TaxID=3155508 RepID=UPI0034225325
MTRVPENHCVDPRFGESERDKLDRDGYVILEGILSESECDDWSRILDEAWIWDQQNLPPHPAGEEPGVQFVRNPLRHSLVFERCVTDPVVLAPARSMIGSRMICHIMNARRSDPGHGRQPLHDLTRKRGRPFPVCNVIWCLDEFTRDNGATRVLPGTHLDDTAALATLADPLRPHPDEVYVTAPRGSVLVFNSQLIHAGTQNDSDRPRRSMQCNFAVDSMPPFYPWREQLSDATKAGLSPLAQQLLTLAPVAA